MYFLCRSICHIQPPNIRLVKVESEVTSASLIVQSQFSFTGINQLKRNPDLDSVVQKGLIVDIINHLNHRSSQAQGCMIQVRLSTETKSETFGQGLFGKCIRLACGTHAKATTAAGVLIKLNTEPDIRCEKPSSSSKCREYFYRHWNNVYIKKTHSSDVYWGVHAFCLFVCLFADWRWFPDFILV